MYNTVDAIFQIFLKSKVNLKYKILKKPPSSLPYMLNILQEAFSYIVVHTPKRYANVYPWMWLTH